MGVKGAGMQRLAVQTRDARLQENNIYAVDVMICLVAIAKNTWVASAVHGPIKRSPQDVINGHMDELVAIWQLKEKNIKVVLVFDGKR